MSFAEAATRDIFLGANTKAARSIPKTLWKLAARKLQEIDSSENLKPLSVPGNNLEKLPSAGENFYSIRINKQFRIVFHFEHGNASNVVIVDYH